MNKKGVGPVVATALLIVVSVIAVIGFQSWFGTYSSSMFVKTEKGSSSTSQIGIETLVGNQLYFKNTLLENITITQIKIGNRECNITQNISTGVHPISLGECVNNLTLDSSIGDIVVITDKNIYAKKHLFKDVTISVQESLESSGSGNYFGDGSDGDIKVNSSGVYQDLGSGYQLHPNTTGTQWNSNDDGDVIVINARNFIVENGVTFSITNRTRGLIIYVTENLIVNGTISMTGRGAHANPVDSISTVNTPVAPSDGNAVPVEGLVIRRIKSNWSDIDAGIISNAHASSIADFNGTHNSSDLFYGTGLKAVNSESNQAEVENGLVIKIPRVGGAGGLSAGFGGSSIKFGFGGGAAGEGNGQGSSGTCFSGGSGGSVTNAEPYGGQGGSDFGYSRGRGRGNTDGTGYWYATQAYSRGGTGGLLLLFVKKDLILGSTGSIKSEGTGGKCGSTVPSGGGSGGGVISLLYGGNLIRDGSISVIGNICWDRPAYPTGGQGSIIGPIKIDP